MPQTPVATIDATGVHVPNFVDVLNYKLAAYKAIYGDDIYLGNDTQDYQWLAIEALSQHEANLAAAAVYAAFSPVSAQGEGLASVVKVNGIQKEGATFSQVDLDVSGTVGAVISNGQVRDSAGNLWSLPASVVVPVSGTVTVTATCVVSGPITAPAGTTWEIATPTLGWAAVSNAADATPGRGVETDVALRLRQTQSVALPSLTVLEGLVGALESLLGVVRVVAYENDSFATDANGLPPNSIALVVDGGDATQIAQTIYKKKTPGVITVGTTNITVTNNVGVTRTINFLRPRTARVVVNVTIKPFSNYVSTTGVAIQQAAADAVNALGIGQVVYLTRLYVPINLPNDPRSQTFLLVSATISRFGGSSASEIDLAFDEAPTLNASDVVITLAP